MPGGGAAAARTARSRWTERHVLALGLAVSGSMVAAAGVATVVTVLRGGSTWAPIHLALAGAATVAIGAFMPHFAVTLAGSAPRSPLERLLMLTLLAAGGTTVVLGGTIAPTWLGGVGAVMVLAGLALVALETLAPTRDPLARRHPIVTALYLVALLELAVGAGLGGLAMAGAGPVLAAWAGLRPAHAWIGFFGAVSLTIFATLVYLAPTVLGARIRAVPALFVAVAGMAVGPPLAAVGFAIDGAALVVGGMALTLVGAVGQLGHLADVVTRRGRFTSEHDWRRVAAGHLLAGPAWFALAVAAALLSVVDAQAPVRGWSIGLTAIPMVAGWLLQELIGSWTHLVPSVTPGGPEQHAAQRRTLAVASRTRLAAHNLGVALLWGGAAAGVAPVAAIGGVTLGAAVAMAVISLAVALARSRS